jgi:serine-type D-Ala-D-Ala carboxypeptidase/endopeptidase (penicillin-binding protein 4)
MTASLALAAVRRRVAPLLAVLAVLPSAAPAQSAARLDRRLDQPPLDRHLWGVAVLDAEGRLRYGRNAERLFTPASNVKLVVTAVATALLGPGWTVRTPLYGSGPVAGGVLQGDLVLAGRGDPTWGRRCFAADTLAPGACDTDPFQPLARLAGALRARGIRAVAGDLVADASWFAGPAVHGTWEHDDLVWGYGAPVTALGFHENARQLTVAPGPAPGAPATVLVVPAVAGLDVENRLVTVPDTAPARFEPAHEAGRVVLRGTVRAGQAPRREQVAVPDGPRFAALAFRQVLADSGIAVAGGVRVVTDTFATRAERAGEPLAAVTSRPLADWVFPILNVSQNWYADLLLRHLGRLGGGSGTWEEGLEVERRFLIDSVALDSTQFRLHDGSGLSGKNLMTPLAFARLLHWMRGHPRFAAFAAGLPRSGAAGSLRTRFLGTPAAGRVRAKTGSIGQANTLSGYLEADTVPGPRPLRTFSIQANHHTLGGRTMIQAIDSVVVELARTAPRPAAARPR